MIINLTYSIHEGMFKYPSEELPTFDQTFSKLENGKYKSARLNTKSSNHHGTHIDAPFHKLPNGKTIDQYPDEKFENYCYLINLQNVRPQREIKPEHLEQALDFPITDPARALILYTGFCDEMQSLDGKLFPEQKLEFEKSFPYLSQETGDYIVKRFPTLNLLGIDSFAVDPQGSNSEVHRILFEKEILPLETLINLSQLRQFAHNRAFLLKAHPEKIPGADAGRTICLAYLFYG